MGQTRLKKVKKDQQNRASTSSLTNDKEKLAPSSLLQAIPNNASGEPEACLVEVRSTSGRGLGLFATSKIFAGTILFSEPPLIRLTARDEGEGSTANGEELKEQALRRCHKALPVELRKSFRSLHDTQKPGFSKEKSIYYSNCYDLSWRSRRGGSAIGLMSSRINHSCCSPNAIMSFVDAENLDSNGSDMEAREEVMVWHAIKDIPRGKEVLSNYISVYQLAAQRCNELRMHYKFDCDCAACKQEGYWANSDTRRRQMISYGRQVKQSEEALTRIKAEFPCKGAEADEHTVDSPATERANDTLYLRSAAAKLEIECATSNLEKLADLLVKEGLQGNELAIVYKNLTKWSMRSGHLRAGSAWKEKHRQVCITCFGASSQRVKEIDNWPQSWWLPK